VEGGAGEAAAAKYKSDPGHLVTLKPERFEVGSGTSRAGFHLNPWDRESEPKGARMPDFRLSPEHEDLRKTVQQFARDVVAPVIGDYYERQEFPYELVAQMGEMGLFGLPFPEEYGGMGGDYFALCLAIEELGRVDSSLAITLEAAVSLGAMPIYRFGTEEQKQQWLPELTSGRMLGAFGLTEASSGSDAGDIATPAVRDGDE